MSTKGVPDPAYVNAQTGVLLGAHLLAKPLEPLVPAWKAEVLTESMGALVTFEGIVRDHDGGQRVTSLTYTAHPTAAADFTRVAAEVSGHHPRVRLITAHATGALHIGDLAFVVLAAAAHRGDAFAAASACADAVKAQVPIWKEQRRADATIDWPGLT